MKNRGSPATISFFSRLGHRFPRVIRSIAVVSFLAAFLPAWFFSQQHRALGQAMTGIDHFRHARITLEKGFLHYSLSGVHGSPSEKKQSGASLLQAAASFDQAVSKFLTIPSSGANELKADLERFQTALTLLTEDGKTDSNESARLRQAFDDLGRKAEDADRRYQKFITGLSERVDRYFILALVFAGLFFLTAGFALCFTGNTRHLPDIVSSENETRFQEAMEATRHGLWDWNIETGDVYYSPGYWRMLGYEPVASEGRSQDWSDLLHPEDRDRVLAINRDCIENRCQTFELECRIKAKDGNWIWISSRGKALARNERGLATRMIGTHVDITGRKITEEQLKESENRLRFALEGTNDGLWDIQLKTGKGYMSPRGCEMLGYAPDELWQNLTTWSDLVHPDDLQQTRDAFMAHLDGKSPIIQVEQRLRTKSGEWKWVLSRGKLVARDEEGIPLRATGTHTDISERKKLENQLAQAQKMEAVGRLAGGVAHDFNNMLGVILGNVDLAMEAVESGIPPREELAEINRAAEHSVDLTRQLLAFARKQTIAPELLNLNTVIEGMLSMLKRLIGENIDLKWHPDSEPWHVKIDPAQTHQLLANLCVNARDAIVHVGRLFIETGKTTFDDTYCSTHDGFKPGDYVRLAVSDNGMGMTKETLNRIFEPFFTTKGIGKGTGLGLSTIYGIVKQNNGFINVYSEIGHGTTFKIYLPKHGMPQTALNPMTLKPTTPKGRGETILLVEDEPTLLNLARRILEAFGYTVMATNSPASAIRMAEEHTGSMELLITDVVMPEMNCKALETEIKRFRPEIRSLFMSGYTENVIAHHGVLDSGIHFIEKPFTKKELAVKVREILDQHPCCAL